MPVLVWLQGSRGPEAQIFHSEQVTGNGAVKNLNLLAQHKISSDEAKKGLDQLAKDYPYVPSTSD